MSMTDIGPLSPTWLWFYLPIATVPGIFILRVLIPDPYVYWPWIESEQGVIENATVLVLFAGITCGLVAYGHRASFPDRRLRRFLLGLIAITVLFAGEEMSWGQHWLGWQTPEAIAAVNRQGEFNLHNLGKFWTSRLPRTVAGLVVIGAGVLFPLWQRRYGEIFTSPADWRYWALPPKTIVPVASLVLATTVLDRFIVWTDLDSHPPFDIDLPELQEFYIAMFLYLYAYAVLRRLRADR